MQKFYYNAIDQKSQQRDGVLHANGRSEAIAHLTSEGLQVLNLNVHSELSENTNELHNKNTTIPSRQRLTSNQLIIFTEELASLISSGFQLEQSLKLMADRRDVPSLSNVAQIVRNDICEGASLSTSLKNASPSFDTLYLNLVTAGEASGSLGELLDRHKTYLVKVQELRNKVATALIYPAFLLLSGLVVTIMFITFLIPKLMVLLDATDSELPAAMTFILALSAFFKTYGIFTFVAVILLCFVLLKSLKSPSVKPICDQFVITSPVIGTVFKALFQVHFLRAIVNLLENGLSLVESLKLTEGITKNQYLKNQISTLTEEVMDGASFWSGIEKRDCFPRGLADYVKMSEQTGNLSQGIGKAAERAEKQFEKNVERLTVLIQPVIIALMAGICGLMAYLMISIIYNTISVLQTS